MYNSQFDIKEVKNGNSDAFSLFFDFHYPKLMGLACRFVDDEKAKDLVQDVFVDFWERKQNLDMTNISSYLSKSIKNKCFNHIKHQEVVNDYANHLKVAHARMEYLTNTNDDNDLFRQVNNRNLRELVETSASKLPPKCQEAFRLCFFNEMTAKEAADLMGVSPRTVEGHIQKALFHLRADLNPFAFWLLFSTCVIQN